ncbi:MAG: outer membrane beta-barrel family protein, partial [Bacteroidota bacterium]|nr:outer membrane beta-barrel family protein [Bacteroidota bacterium]
VPLPSVTSSPIHLGSIALVALTKQLKEVQVVALKPVLAQDADKLTYNVDADPESKTATGFDILRKIPMLSLDADDNLQLNGSGNFRVLINGKSSSLFLYNLSDAFKNLSASAIKTIEVLTVPPSKYEAQGTGGIINITTYKKSIGGYNGGINVRVSSPQAFSLSSSLTVNTGKFGFSGNVGYNNSTNPTNKSFFSRQDKIRQDRLEQTGVSNNDNRSQNAGGEISYELNSRNLITASYSLNTGRSANNFNQRVTLFNAAGQPVEVRRNLNTGTGKLYGNDIGLDYQHNAKKNDAQQLTLSYRRSNSTNSSMTDFILQSLVNNKNRANTTNSEDGFNEQTFRADYVQPISKHTLELGASSIIRKNSSDYFYKNEDTVTGALVLDTSRSNIFNYREDIYAAYTSLSLKIGKWGVRAGVRLEQAKVDARFVSSRTFAARDYQNLIPNITLSRQLKGISMIKLSYTQRINRPNLDYLNPYIDLTDPWNISYGNPGLQPTVGHVFNAAYNTFIKKTSFNIGFFHQFTNNSVQEFTTLGADTIARTTFGNIGQNRNYTLSLNGTTTVFKKLGLNLNSAANYVQYTSIINGKPYNNEGLTYHLSGSANFRSKGWRVSGNASYNTPNVFLQGRSAGYLSNSFSVNRQFSKNNKASVGISVTSPFRAYRRSYTEVNDPAFYLFRESYSVMRRYHLSFNYRFGKVQSDTKRKKPGIEYDYVKASEQNDSTRLNFLMPPVFIEDGFLMPPVFIEDSRPKAEGKKE